MNLIENFFIQLKHKDFSKKDIRFLGVEQKLKEKIGSMSTTDFSKEYNVNTGTLSYMLRGKRAIPLSLLYKNIDFSEYYCIIQNSSNGIKIPKILTPKLAYIVGLLRDGTVTVESKNEYVCAFYNKNKTLMKIFKTLIQELFGLKCTIKLHWNGVYRTRIRSKTLYLFLTLLFDITNDQSKWDTPKIIKSSSNEIKKAYINGFFDAEGGIPHVEKNIDLKKKNLYIKFVQKNKNSLEFIKNYLEKNNIKTRNIYWEQRKFVLKISNSSIPRFADFIKPFHPQKLSRLKKLSKIFSNEL